MIQTQDLTVGNLPQFQSIEDYYKYGKKLKAVKADNPGIELDLDQTFQIVNKCMKLVYGLSFYQINIKSSVERTVITRQAHSYFMKKYSFMSNHYIGKLYTAFRRGEGQAHGNVSHSIATYESQYRNYPLWKQRHEVMDFELKKQFNLLTF